MAAAAMAAAFPFATAEHAVLRQTSWTPALAATLLASCCIGLGMSHATYLLRSNVSATTASVVGVVCKLLTVRPHSHGGRHWVEREMGGGGGLDNITSPMAGAARASCSLTRRSASNERHGISSPLSLPCILKEATRPQERVLAPWDSQVVYSLLLWDVHASYAGMACLLASIAFGALYKQAPMRADRSLEGDEYELRTVEAVVLLPSHAAGRPKAKASDGEELASPGQAPGKQPQLVLSGWRGSRNWQNADLVAVVGLPKPSSGGRAATGAAGAAAASVALRSARTKGPPPAETTTVDRGERVPTVRLLDRRDSTNISVSSEVLEDVFMNDAQQQQHKTL